jgi:hypothetical protein
VPLSPADSAYFPYAVVEIKLTATPPPWVEGLLELGGCMLGSFSLQPVTSWACCLAMPTGLRLCLPLLVVTDA